jgi:hypothetical protein
MRRFHGGRTVLALVGALVLLLALPVAASAYTSRRAARVERAANLRDARLTQPCGYAGSGRLSSVRVVSYTARGLSFKWGAVLWTPSGQDAQGCVLVFLHAAGYDFHSVETPKHATVDWLAFTWGIIAIRQPVVPERPMAQPRFCCRSAQLGRAESSAGLSAFQVVALAECGAGGPRLGGALVRKQCTGPGCISWLAD